MVGTTKEGGEKKDRSLVTLVAVLWIGLLLIHINKSLGLFPMVIPVVYDEPGQDPRLLAAMKAKSDFRGLERYALVELAEAEAPPHSGAPGDGRVE